MKDRENKKHICSKGEMESEVAEDFKHGISLAVTERDRCPLQSDKEQESEKVESGRKDLAETGATSLQAGNDASTRFNGFLAKVCGGSKPLKGQYRGDECVASYNEQYRC